MAALPLVQFLNSPLSPRPHSAHIWGRGDKGEFRNWTTLSLARSRIPPATQATSVSAAKSAANPGCESLQRILSLNISKTTVCKTSKVKIGKHSVYTVFILFFGIHSRKG